MLKVLHITPMYPSADRPAFGIFVKRQIDSISEDVDVSVEVLPGRNGIWPYIKSIPRVFRMLSRPWDIVHVHFGSAGSLVKLVNVFFGRKVVTSYCGGDLLGNRTPSGDFQKKSLILRKVNIWLSSWDAFSIVKSQELKDQIVDCSRNIGIVPNGIDVEQFRQLDKSECRKKLGIPDDGKKVILFPADSNDRNKNFQLAEQALIDIDRESYHLITFAGKGVDFSLIPSYLNAADLILFTSLSEGSPNTVKEAMACNCRIYSSPCGDVEWLLDGVEGSRVIGYNDEDWKNAVEAYFKGEDEVQSNSRQEFYNKGLDMANIANRIVEIYNGLSSTSPELSVNK